MQYADGSTRNEICDVEGSTKEEVVEIDFDDYLVGVKYFGLSIIDRVLLKDSSYCASGLVFQFRSGSEKSFLGDPNLDPNEHDFIAWPSKGEHVAFFKFRNGAMVNVKKLPIGATTSPRKGSIIGVTGCVFSKEHNPKLKMTFLSFRIP